MRVLTFSFGFGPTFFKIEPHAGYFWFTTFAGKVRLRLGKHDPERHGPTVYQVAMIPFLAYVQIAGMNPFEEQDPQDKGSYANASLVGRISTIFGGPLANYLFASVFFFFSFFYGGIEELPPEDQRETVVNIMPGHPAEEAGIEDGDRIVKVADIEVSMWEQMAEVISAHPRQGDRDRRLAQQRATQFHDHARRPGRQGQDRRCASRSTPGCGCQRSCQAGGHNPTQSGSQFDCRPRPSGPPVRRSPSSAVPA